MHDWVSFHRTNHFHTPTPSNPLPRAMSPPPPHPTPPIPNNLCFICWMYLLLYFTGQPRGFLQEPICSVRKGFVWYHFAYCSAMRNYNFHWRCHRVIGASESTASLCPSLLCSHIAFGSPEYVTIQYSSCPPAIRIGLLTHGYDSERNRCFRIIQPADQN